ncbi:ABC transporter permease [Nocardioides acrostichi]|uniref:ABC transporter permease n=1 Tax=Nocardioides acrostichi TaxID=2784339 RepID=A0A930V0M1_9ACTN|nr:ABC transporter permease [Nocardioides acrostichi]MBF4161552.1 ABC transporter permease [Nocardioides acrostichi]
MESIQNWWDFVQTRQDDVIKESLVHLRLVAITVVMATIIAVSVGILVSQRPLLRALALSISSTFLTIPSLALFALFVPLVGTGNMPAIIAMTMYALLPILRNTVTGLDAVSPAVVESAKGMGMNGRQQLVRVRLPLAYPLIMAGIRVATLLTVGIAAIAVLVGGGGLGDFIRLGINQQGFPFANYAVVTGVVFIVLIGLVLDIALATFQRFTTARGLRS